VWGCRARFKAVELGWDTVIVGRVVRIRTCSTTFSHAFDNNFVVCVYNNLYLMNNNFFSISISISILISAMAPGTTKLNKLQASLVL
jgi:hypothetical protein